MLKRLLLLSGLLASAVTQSATLSMTSSPVSMEQAGETFTVSITVSEVIDLHSAEIVLVVPSGAEPVAETLTAGPFLESNGGDAVVYAEIAGQRISLSQALLGIEQDVDGGGVLGSFQLRVPQVPTTPISIPFESVTLKNTTGTELTDLTIEPLQIVNGSVPTITLRSNVTSIASVGQTANIEIYAENVRDLHSYGLTMPYSSSALTVVDMDEGPFMASVGAQTVFVADDTGNAVEISHAVLGIGQDVSGSGVLANVLFRAESLEQLPTTLTVTDVDMIDTFVVNWGPMVIAESLELLSGDEDTDNDQLLDSWEILYFGAIDDPRAIPTADPDRDGQNNYLEYLAGLNPMDPASLLNVQIDPHPSISDRMLIKVWPTVPGRSYQVEVSSDLSGWGDMIPVSVSDDGDIRIFSDDTDPAEIVFYRILITF